MDQDTRNKLQRATQDARRALEAEFAEQLEGTFDILPNGTILPQAGRHLDEYERLTRSKLVDAVQHLIAGGKSSAEAVDAYKREAAFGSVDRRTDRENAVLPRVVAPMVAFETGESGSKRLISVAETDPELARVVAAWPKLSAVVKRMILAALVADCG